MNESQTRISRNTSTSNLSLPKLPTLYHKPKFLEMKGYKNYKYQSYMIDLMQSDKKLQKLLPYHLQNITKTPRKRYELTPTSKKELLYFNRLENVFTDESELDHAKTTAITQSGVYIQNQYRKTLRSFEQDSQNTKRGEESIINEEITLNNSIISNIIGHQKLLSINPRIIAQMKKEPYKEMNTIKEFKVLVKNTNQFISMYDHKSKSPLTPFIFQFILRESYLSFAELPKITQDRILLAFDINPQNEQDKIYYNQFRLFKQIIISQYFKEQDLIDFFIKFFNPDNSPFIYMEEIRAILTLIVQQSENMNQLVKCFLKNIEISPYVQDNMITDLQGLLKSKTLDSNNLIYLLLNNV